MVNEPMLYIAIIFIPVNRYSRDLRVGSIVSQPSPDESLTAPRFIGETQNSKKTFATRSPWLYCGAVLLSHWVEWRVGVPGRVGWGYQKRLSRDLLIISLIEVNSVQHRQQFYRCTETKVSQSTDQGCLRLEQVLKYYTLIKSEIQVVFKKFLLLGVRGGGMVVNHPRQQFRYGQLDLC